MLNDQININKPNLTIFSRWLNIIVIWLKQNLEMGNTALDRVRLRRSELAQQIVKLQEERDRLDAYLLVHDEYSQPLPRVVSGREIDALCQMVLREAYEPLTPAQLVKALSEQFGAVIDTANPARLVSTRMSMLASVESTQAGWRLAPKQIDVESQVYK